MSETAQKSISMNIMAYKEYIFALVLFLFIGFIARTMIRNLLQSLDNPVRKDQNSSQGELKIFLVTGSNLGWTISLFIVCRIYFAELIPDELLNFTFILIKIQTLFITTLLIARGLNQILHKIVISREVPDLNKATIATDVNIQTIGAITNAISWICAAMVSILMLNILVITQSSIITLLILLAALTITLYAPIHFYKTSEGAYQLITSIIGYYYLKSELQSLKKDQQLILNISEKSKAPVQKISLLHTSFIINSGETEIRSNADLMVLNFGFKGFGAFGIQGDSKGTTPVNLKENNSNTNNNEEIVFEKSI